MELKTRVLRHLPVLVYNPQTSKIADGTEPDPTVTSIYFDNPKFSLYTKKVGHEPDAPSLRLRWYGPLEEETDIIFEKKIIKEGDVSEEERFLAKDRHIKALIRGDYKMERSIDRMKAVYGEDSDRVKQFEQAISDIQQLQWIKGKRVPKPKHFHLVNLDDCVLENRNIFNCLYYEMTLIICEEMRRPEMTMRIDQH